MNPDDDDDKGNEEQEKEGEGGGRKEVTFTEPDPVLSILYTLFYLQQFSEVDIMTSILFMRDQRIAW